MQRGVLRAVLRGEGELNAAKADEGTTEEGNRAPR